MSSLRKKEIIIHIVCWLAYCGIIFYWQSNVFDSSAALFHTTRFVVIEVIVFYFNLYFLLPRFFVHGKYLIYSLFIVLILFFSHSVFDHTSQFSPPPHLKDENNITRHEDKHQEGDLPRHWERIIIFTLVNVIPALFFSSIFWISNENRKQKQREITLINENLNSEMRFLKSQINPHFLFNALNNIYSLSFTQSEKAPHMIMKLSEMLRHVVYDSSNSVRLEKEILYIDNFIDFQKLKIGEEIDVTFDHQQADDSFIVEPMLLIPFVENAFKHSDIENNPKGFIHIRLSTSGTLLDLEVENSTPSVEHTKDRFSGVGIENVTKRLDLAYPGKSRFRKEISENSFKIHLTLQRQ